MKKYLVAAVVIIIIIIVIQRIRPEANFTRILPRLPYVKTEPKPVPAPVVSNANTTSSNTAFSNFSTVRLKDSSTETAAKEIIGLCQYSDEKNVRLISLVDYTRLRKSKSRYIVFPHFHSHCFLGDVSGNFKIVDYSFEFDAVSDVLGDVKLSLRNVKDFDGMESLMQSSEFKTDFLGYKSISKVVENLRKQGIGKNTKIRLFELLKKEKAKVRKPSGDYRFFPGITFYKPDPKGPKGNKRSGIEYSVNRKEKKDPNYKSDRKSLPYFYELDVPYLLPTEKIQPIYTKYKDQLNPFSSIPSFYILSRKDDLKYSINFSNLLRFVKSFRKLTPTIVKVSDDFKDIESFEDSNSISGNVTYKELKADEKNLIIDTRVEQKDGTIIFKNSFSLPTDKDIQINTQKISESIEVEKIKSLAKDKRVVLIGNDSFDISPNLVKQLLAQINVSAQVYQPGFLDLELRQKLGLVPKEFKKKLEKANSYKVTKIAPENAKANGVRKLYERKVNKPKSLKKPNSRPYLPKEWNKKQ